MKLEPDAAVWPLGSLRISRLYDLIEVHRASGAGDLELRLVELVEVIQVLDWLAGGSSVGAWDSLSARSPPPESSS